MVLLRRVTHAAIVAGLQELHALKGLHWLTVQCVTPLSDAAQERLVASLPNLTLYNLLSLMGAGG